MKKIPIDWLRCPITREKLDKTQEGLESSCCRYKWHGEGDFWDMRPSPKFFKALENYKAWKHLQENGMVSYTEDPYNNLGVGDRKEHIAFAEFCNFEGKILDIGAGPQKEPAHLCKVPRSAYFIGIDPLRGFFPKKYNYIQGFGEYLPFRGCLFDQILFVTSLDHMIDPIRALEEAIRVLEHQGSILIFMGEKDPDTPPPEKTHEWYENLDKPKKAHDKFHLYKFDEDKLSKMFARLGLEIKRHKKVEVNPWKKHHFLEMRQSQ